jgi:hypothetical protein
MGLFTIRNKDISFIINEMGEVENVDARSFIKSYHVRAILPVFIRIIEHLRGFCPQTWYGPIFDEANAIAEERMKVLDGIELPHQLNKLLGSDLFKKEQIKLLKGISLSADQLGGLFVQAGSQGYRFSNYRFKGIPKEYREKDLPTFIYLKDDGNLDTYGSTSLSDGELRDLVIRSKFIVARILDNGKKWHCFYQTKSGVQGKEPGKLGANPHIHYISDSFGISRDDFIKALKGGRVPSSEVHIRLII